MSYSRKKERPNIKFLNKNHASQLNQIQSHVLIANHFSQSLKTSQQEKAKLKDAQEIDVIINCLVKSSITRAHN